MGALHHHILMGFIVLLFGRDFQDDRINFFPVHDQALHKLFAGILCDEDNRDIGVLKESFENVLHIVFVAF